MEKSRILIIDDLAFDAESDLRMPLMEVEEFEVLEIATTFKEAIYAIQHQKPDLVIVDIQLEQNNDSNADGIEIARLLEEKRIPYLLLTGHSETYFQSHIIPFGRSNWFPKPIRPNFLRKLVRNLLDGSRASDDEDPKQNQIKYDYRQEEFTIKSKYIQYYVPRHKLFYCEGDGAYTWISVEDPNEANGIKSLHLSKGLEAVDAITKKAPDILRISKHGIINLDYVSSFDKDEDKVTLTIVVLGHVVKKEFDVDPKYRRAFLSAREGRRKPRL